MSSSLEVHGIDRVEHALHVKRILGNFAEEYNCEVHNQELITDVANLANSLLFLKRMVDDATSNVPLFDERSCEMLGQAALIVRELSAFATGRFGDLLFSVTKAAVSCANTGHELLSQNIMSTRRWGMLTGRLVTLEFDVDRLLRSQVLLQLAPDDARTSSGV